MLAESAPSTQKGEIVLLWKEEHAAFEVEAAKIWTPNMLALQLVTGRV